jgi:hypothetical protein
MSRRPVPAGGGVTAKKKPGSLRAFFPLKRIKRCLPAATAAATGIAPVAATTTTAARTTTATARLVLGFVYTQRATAHILTVEVLDSA